MGSYPFLQECGENYEIYIGYAIGDYEDKDEEAKDTQDWVKSAKKYVDKIKPVVEQEISKMDLKLVKYDSGLKEIDINKEYDGPCRIRIKLQYLNIFVDQLAVILAFAEKPDKETIENVKERLDKVVKVEEFG